ncbi:septation ring formation regulator EzrA [Levilactobacillus bambusae]|uniref:Septation ring formation regulator EzrA n=1 Tax=Levilactobacillus bambusae TaxID=2024736 RepID=A0A2V1MZH0_9LACO|nr:septation ring formation regulator EzrA [Levilactobacillus bambusae]PWF99554.1 septation ring formation regulator EzrA [Levilactobacillus bambusae]
MLRVLIGIIILALVIYIGVLIYQYRVRRQLNALRETQATLQNVPLKTDLESARELSLTGHSLEQFQQLEQIYQDLTDNNFHQIDELLGSIETDVKGFNVVKTQENLTRVNQLIDQAAAEIDQVQEGLTGLKQVDQKHHQAVTDLEKEYQDLRKTLLAKNFSFGPSIDGLEEMLASLENDFDHFAKLTNAGDHEKAEDVLNQLQQDTNRLEQLIEEIPALYKDLATEYPDQLEEIQTGYQQLSEQNYHFGTVDIMGEVAEIQKQIDENLNTLRDLRTDDARVVNDQIEAGIDHLYDVMETELTARPKVEENLDRTAQFIAHAQNQNQTLRNELDRLGQNYTLDHQEVETARELNNQLKQIHTTYQDDIQDITDKTATYSMILTHQTQLSDQLGKIEEKQTQINEGVAGLADEERQARKTLRNFDFKMHAIKRGIENLNLPGLPKAYLDYFFMVSDEVDRLADDMNQVQINMEDITKQLIMIQSDLDTLEEKSNDLMDSALLSEQLIQYANRYRASHEDVAKASQQALAEFDHDYDYAKSLETIAMVLDQVEPGSYNRLETEYYKQKDRENPIQKELKDSPEEK